MSKKNWSNILSVLARTALAFVFVFGQTVWAGQNQKAKDKADSAQKTAQPAGKPQSSAAPGAGAQNKEAQSEGSKGTVATEKPSDGKHEDLKVHGHWSIEVRNPNGTVVTHREFENSLVIDNTCCTGSGLLASVLGRALTVGPWEVRLSGNNPVCAGNGECWISESPVCSIPIFASPIGQSAANTSCNLGVAMAQIQSNGKSTLAMVLSGSTTASTSGDFTFVQTWNLTGTGTTPLINVAGYGPVTGAFLPSTVQVAAGQIIAVTVQISLS
jgi:hypothetical protein